MKKDFSACLEITNIIFIEQSNGKFCYVVGNLIVLNKFEEGIFERSSILEQNIYLANSFLQDFTSCCCSGHYIFSIPQSELF